MHRNHHLLHHRIPNVPMFLGIRDIDAGSDQAAPIRARFGEMLMDQYMEILSDPCVWETHAKCAPCKKGCLTPRGFHSQPSSEAPGDTHRRKLRWYVAGTVCVDVSMMGNRLALLGESSISLAIFLAMVRDTQPEITTHECTSYFSQFLFDKYLPEFTVHRISVPGDEGQRSALRAGFQSNTWLLSPHQVGWPCFRPRQEIVWELWEATWEAVSNLQTCTSVVFSHRYLLSIDTVYYSNYSMYMSYV